jgi:hypothetical protein
MCIFLEQSCRLDAQQTSIPVEESIFHESIYTATQQLYVIFFVFNFTVSNMHAT